MLSHHSCDALVVDLAALRLADLRRHPPPAVPASMFVLRVSNLLDQLFIVERALRWRTLARRVESAARYPQQLAHHRRRIGLSMLFDPRVLHIDSPGSSGALLRRRPLRTVRASFPAHGSSHPTARKRTGPATTELASMRSALEVCSPCRVERIGIAANLRVALYGQCRRSEEVDFMSLLDARGTAGEYPIS
jgi:hypothetical protein